MTEIRSQRSEVREKCILRIRGCQGSNRGCFVEGKEKGAVKMKNFFVKFAILFFAAFLLAVPEIVSAGDKYQQMINCDLHAGPCEQSLSKNTVILEVAPRPVKALQNLSFKLTLTGKPFQSVKAPYIDLGMPGMNMGPNRVQLRPTGNNTYEGQGVIVKCPSGRRTWQATVTIPDTGQTKFIFDVIY